MLKRHLFLLLLLFRFLGISAFTLSDDATVSIFTCAPGKVLYAKFGHTAVRVLDKENKIDLVFNYGTFNFDSENFYLKFVKGETDYRLSVYGTHSFFIDYSSRARVWEQKLNLTQPEKQQLFDALLLNAEPPNRVYRYNFFFDNCSTRPHSLVEQNVAGTITYAYSPEPRTFRQLVTQHTGKHSWDTFGIDLLLGLPDDRIATEREHFFLPLELMNFFETAQVNRNGVVSPLVEKAKIVIENELNEVFTPWYISPIFVMSMLLLVVALLSFFLRNKSLIWLDAILFSAAGLLGVIVFFLVFFSVHPAVSPNFHLLWAHPLQLVFVLLLPFKKLRKCLSYYQILTAIMLIGLMAGIFLIPQQFNAAMYPLWAALFLRAIFFIKKFKV